MENLPDYLRRGTDGFLCYHTSIYNSDPYKTPDEAIKTWWAGEQRFGCNERTFSSYKSHPCSNSAKYDPDVNGNPTKCGHHSIASKERKRLKAEAKTLEWRKESERKQVLYNLNQEKEEIIRKIAAGHNDARSLCQDWIKRWDDLQ